MRLTIRWKLILSIVAPLLIIAAVVMWFTFDRIIQYSTERNHDLVTEQARYYAARLNDRFSRVALIAQGTANAIANMPLASEAAIYELLRANLVQDPLVYGSAIAFEPGEYKKDIELFAPYVFRQGDGLASMDIGSEGYDYTTLEWAWFAVTRARGTAHWSDPYLDEGAGNILMNTYSVPFYREGRFAGVTTVDVSLKDMASLIDFGNVRNYPFIIVDASGRFISHPDPDMIWNGSVTGNAERFSNPVLNEFAEKLVSGQAGMIKVKDPELFQSDEMFWIFYAPIEMTHWAFAMVVPESEILGFLNSQLRRGVIGLVIMITLIIICVLIIGTSLTRPLTVLNNAVKGLARGDLNLEITGIQSRDEIGELASGFNAMVAQLRRHMHALTREVAVRESYESEMEFANQVQASLLPSDSQSFPELDQFDLYGINRPARHVAGDFFDFFMLDNHRLILVIADVSGKGMASALLMAVTRTIVRSQARSGKTPVQILYDANRLLIETNMRSLYVTMFIASYDILSGHIIYANAGHPRPFKVCCDDKVTKFGDTTGTIVGMLEEAEFSEASEQLDPGDVLVLYTDGVPDARSPDGQFFGEENFIDLLKICTGKTAREICEYTVDILIGYQGNILKDDMTLLVIKRN